ncbi:MAG: hypothetical protein DWQ01_16405 [Planctomycetota bacterium]|nr:MAG: hypothetical protein DWQ01_16405 [Planctomycetota bacterium]
MYHRQRGAVSLMWLIATGVIALLSLGFAFLSQQAFSKERDAKDTARQQAQTKETQRQEINDKALEITRVVGFAGTEAGSLSNADTIKGKLQDLASQFPSLSSPVNLQEALNGVSTDYNGATTQIRNLTADVERLTNELASAQAAYNQSLSEKDGQIRDLTGQLEDARNRAANDVAALERTRDALRVQVRDQQNAVTEMRALKDEAERQANAEKQTLVQRNNILSDRLNSVSRSADTADGAVLAVSGELMKGWMDLGQVDRIRAGMVFQVRNTRNNALKGEVRVVQVEEKTSQFEIISQADRFDPIAEEDALFNDLYDGTRELVAVLLGDGFGKYSEDDVKALLSQVGIRVQSDVTREVDYLVLGTPFFDEDTGELLPWDNQEAYKAATSNSVQIVPFRDAMAWLGL